MPVVWRVHADADDLDRDANAREALCHASHILIDQWDDATDRVVLLSEKLITLTPRAENHMPGSPTAKIAVAEKPKVAATKLSVHTRGTWVRAAVKEQPNTTQIIDGIMPYFPLTCQVISGWLSDEDLYWKVNYHWDLLVSRLELFSTLKTTTADGVIGAQSILKNLWTVPPNPPRGYTKDKNPGDTKDQTGHARTIERHAILKPAKTEAKLLFAWGGVLTTKLEKDPPKAEKPWWLSVAPVANPTSGKHATGYALDIAGSNETTTRIARMLGATLVFNEASHVHCEFKKGVPDVDTT